MLVSKNWIRVVYIYKLINAEEPNLPELEFDYGKKITNVSISKDSIYLMVGIDD